MDSHTEEGGPESHGADGAALLSLSPPQDWGTKEKCIATAKSFENME